MKGSKHGNSFSLCGFVVLIEQSVVLILAGAVSYDIISSNHDYATRIYKPIIHP
jgi:hypothetical protein